MKTAPLICSIIDIRIQDDMTDFLNKMVGPFFSADTIKQRLYLHAGIVLFVLVIMITISVWSGNTLTAITAIARFERTHTVSRLEAKASLLEYLDTRNAEARTSFYENMAITQSYNKMFGRLLDMRTTLPDDQFAQVIENTFKEADQKTAVTIVNRINVLFWHPIIKELVEYAQKAHLAGQQITDLAGQVMAADTKTQQLAVLKKIKSAEADFISYEHNFSKRCSDLAHEISAFVKTLFIFILIFSVGFTSLLIFLLTQSIFKQTRRHAKDLEASRKLYRDLVERTPDLISRIDTDGKIVFVNHAALDIYGLTPEACTGKNVFDFIHPDDRASSLSAYQTWIKSHEPVLIHENRQMGKNKCIHHMSWTSIAEKDDNQQIIGLACTGRDITKRKAIEKALKKSEERLRLIIKGSNDAPWDWDLISNKIYYSPQWWAQIGYKSDELPSDAGLWEQLLHPEDKARVDHIFTGALEKGLDSYEVEFRLQHKHGHWVPVLSRGFITRDKNTPIRVTGTNMDLTQLKQSQKEKEDLQNQLVQAQRIESIGKLASGIAHDFNNILYPVIGFTEMSIEELDKDHPVQHYLTDILNGAKRARDLVKRILLFSRQKDQVLLPTRLGPVIEESLSLLRSTIPANITIQKDLCDGRERVLCDATDIHEIVMNLCTNAFYALKEKGGTIRISLKKTSPGNGLAIKTDHCLCLAVKDDGSGMSPDVIARIFDPYFTTNAIGKGSGLGLSVVHGIVRNYKGDIQVDSVPGKGSVFKVFLPVTDKAASAPPIEKKNVSLVGSETILFVDDEPAIVKLGTIQLKRFGYSVSGFDDSRDALAAFQSDPGGFDLVITDMQMPDMIGTQLAKIIWGIRPDMPIIICSGYSEALEKEKNQLSNIKAIIDKPILMDELTNMVRQVLDQHHTR
jgi:PAS domain S-box-containing protein